MKALTQAEAIGAAGQHGPDGIRELARAHRAFALKHPSAMVALFAADHGVIALEISHFFEDRIDIDAVFWSVVDGSLRTISDLVARSKPLEDGT
jgi:hypothetical protein